MMFFDNLAAARTEMLGANGKFRFENKFCKKYLGSENRERGGVGGGLGSRTLFSKVESSLLKVCDALVGRRELVEV